jgi:hypothetical protein
MPAKLVVCNGAFKSGSTWVYNIVIESVVTKSFDEKYKDKYHEGSINIGMLKEFSSEVKKGVFATKAHQGNSDKLKLVREDIDIKVIMIERDPRSVLLSYYHHLMRSIGVKIPYNIFYWLIGKYKLCEVSNYNRKWNGESELDVLWLKFENLKRNPVDSIENICSFIGDDATDNYDLVAQNTTLEALRNKQKDESSKLFFRGGEVAEWKKVFSDSFSSKVISDYARPSNLTKIITYILFDLRRKLSRQKTYVRGV